MLRIAAGSSFQDFGRPGYRQFGVPRGGAFDRESFQIGNALLGNTADAAAVEMPLMGGTFLCEKACSVAVVGAACSITVDGRDERRNCFPLASGELLDIGAATAGVRCYLCAAGEFEVEQVLGSGSGGLVGKGVPLEFKSGLNEPFRSDEYSRKAAKLASPLSSLNRTVFRFVLGPQGSLFDVAEFERTAFKVALESDRKGIRLAGAFGGHSAEIPSEPAVLGAIQITPSGMPIIVGPDGPTIGGYPKIGAVISADLSALGQLGPGSEVRFEQVSLEEAVALHQEEEDGMRKMVRGLRARWG